ncbi:uncharacterized protein [Primulina eburnea]|uniref:uncharacterized protein isoform X2 n=1 Tax=Primulina eburnea TaxID=1245227 RepID=UPI003C6BDB7F
MGTSNNAGAILVLGRDLVVVPKLIHPLPPAISSPETSPECHIKTRRCRNSMLTEHLHPLEAVLKLLMTEVLLLGFRFCFQIFFLYFFQACVNVPGISCDCT